MATHTHTPHYNLSQFGPGDRPSWIDDYNQDMRTIDTALTQGGAQPEPLFCTAETGPVERFNVSFDQPYTAAFSTHNGTIAVDTNTHTIPITKSGYYSVSGYAAVPELGIDSGDDDKTLVMIIMKSGGSRPIVMGIFTKSYEPTPSKDIPQLQTCSIPPIIVHLNAGDAVSMLISPNNPNATLHGSINTMYLTLESKNI